MFFFSVQRTRVIDEGAHRLLIQDRVEGLRQVGGGGPGLLGGQDTQIVPRVLGIPGLILELATQSKGRRKAPEPMHAQRTNFLEDRLCDQSGICDIVAVFPEILGKIARELIQPLRVQARSDEHGPPWTLPSASMVNPAII